jgi:hypothetical protein
MTRNTVNDGMQGCITPHLQGTGARGADTSNGDTSVLRLPQSLTNMAELCLPCALALGGNGLNSASILSYVDTF